MSQPTLPRRPAALLRNLLLAIATPILLGNAVSAASADKPAPAADAASAADAGKTKVRAELFKILTPAQAQVSAKQFKEALATLKGIDTVKDVTPVELALVRRMRAVAYVGNGDLELAEADMQQVIEDPQVSKDDRLQLERMMARTWYGKQPPERALQWAKRFLAEGGVDDVMHTIITQTLYKSGDCTATVEAVQAALAAAETAGIKPSEGRLQMLAACQQKLKDLTGQTATLEKLAVAYPNKDYWNRLISLVMRKDTFAEYAVLDGMRLRLAAGSLIDPEEYVDMAQLAYKVGYPEEARRVLEAGEKAGTLSADKAGVDYVKLRALVETQSAEDRKLLGQGDARAESAKNGVALFSTGYNYVSHQKFDVGLSMMERGIARGGLPHADLAQLELGMALVQANRPDDARKALEAVKGADGAADLAHLWLLSLQKRS